MTRYILYLVFLVLRNSWVIKSGFSMNQDCSVLLVLTWCQNILTSEHLWSQLHFFWLIDFWINPKYLNTNIHFISPLGESATFIYSLYIKPHQWKISDSSIKHKKVVSIKPLFPSCAHVPMIRLKTGIVFLLGIVGWDTSEECSWNLDIFHL